MSRRALGTIVVILAVILSIVGADTVFVLNNRSYVNHAVSVQQANLQAACLRFNVVRSTQNRSAYADWRFDRTFLKLVVPRTGSNVKQKRPVPNVFVNVLTDAIATKAWVPTSPCTGFLTQDSLVAPASVPFNKALPPSADL